MDEKDRVVQTLNSLRIFRGVPFKEIERLYYAFTPKVSLYNKGDVIIKEGELSDCFGVVIEGSVIGTKITTDNISHLNFVLTKGGVFNLESAVSRLKETPITTIAREDCSVLMLDFDVLNMESIEHVIKDNLIEFLADLVIKQNYRIEILSATKVRDRLEIFFHVLSKKSKDSFFNIKMTQNELAEYLCVNRSALCKELNLMKKEGIIDFRGNEYKLLKDL